MGDFRQLPECRRKIWEGCFPLKVLSANTVTNEDAVPSVKQLKSHHLISNHYASTLTHEYLSL